MPSLTRVLLLAALISLLHGRHGKHLARAWDGGRQVLPDLGRGGAQVGDGGRDIGCSYRGRLNMTTFQCTCVSGYTGPDCSLRLCPVGNAWASYATADDKAHARWTECSNMGHCDRSSGQCRCRPGFEGAGCERLACPTNKETREVCSNRGKCMTMREAAQAWNGRTLFRPGIKYDNWDADQITGCICDEGFGGYDCSVALCPSGDEFLTGGQANERVRVKCQAQGGRWFFSFMGQTSRAIPYNAGYGTVERMLEEMASVTDVRVSFSNLGAQGGGQGLAPACGSDYDNVMTIEFMQQFGPLPAARVEGSGLTGGRDTKVQMVSSYKLECGGGAMGGQVYFTFEGEVSPPVPHDASEAQVANALKQLPSLGGPLNPYGNASVHVDMGSREIGLCSQHANHVTNVTVSGAYGNLGPLGLVNSLFDLRGLYGQVNLSATDEGRGSKENTECNSHGVCNQGPGKRRGSCVCSQLVVEGTNSIFKYRYTSSDGYGNKGRRGDCGHSAEPPLECPLGRPQGSSPDLRASPASGLKGSGIPCSGRGECSNATFTCACHHGYSGPACESRSCPMGKAAWFDEATTLNRAHGPSTLECSGRGICDAHKGECVCDDLFEGAACDRLKCPGSNGDPCSGHGRCLPLWRLALEAQTEQGIASPFEYGTSDRFLNPPNLWDREMVQGCHCDSRNDMQPYSGPKALISGVIVDNPKAGGYSGYDCSRRWCPRGDDPLTAGLHEVQTVGCSNMTANFTLEFRGQRSLPINPRATEEEFEAILQELTTIGDVQVTYPSEDVLPSRQKNSNMTACDPSYGPFRNENGTGFLGVRVEFLTELGDLPDLVALFDPPPQAPPRLAERLASSKKRGGKGLEALAGPLVLEAVKGTKESSECSGRGLCDYESGECKCLPGFSSSGGNGSTSGLRRDCGRRSEDGFTLNPVYP